MPAGEAGWGWLDGEKVESISEFDSLLNRYETNAIKYKYPIVIELISPSGDSLGIGLGRAESLLVYVPGSLLPPYYSSVGEVQAEGEIVFYHCGEPTEYPRRNAIPVGLARDAVRSFFTEGKLPDFVKWEEV